MITQHFKVTEQQIERLEWRSLVADSRNLLTFQFAFDPLWDGVVKTAVVTTGGATYHCLIGADGTIAPANMPVLRAGECTVSVFGGDLYTVGACVLSVSESGLRGGSTPIQPPPDIYNQILVKATSAETHATTAEALANDSQNKAAIEAKRAGDSAVAAGASAEAAGLSQTAAAGSAQSARDTVVGFDTHAAAKAKLVTDEGTRQAGLVTTEGTRQVGLVSAEGATQTAAAKLEADRAAGSAQSAKTDAGKTAADRLVVESAAGAETARADAEKSRVDAETGRKTAEGNRTKAETGRVDAEAARKAAEGTRIIAETGRNEAERQRESTTSGIVTRAAAQATAATEQATAATEQATRAAGSAATATSKAATATEQATLSTGKAATATEKATLATEQATAAAKSATTATEQATLATGKATAAGTSAMEAAASAKQADDAVKSIALRKYSVRFTGAAPAGVREDSAVGMVANVATGGETVQNDFDKVSFFDRPICCCTRSPAAKSGWMVNAYRGEPGFAADGSNGEVMYECKPFYYKASPDLTYVSVMATPLEGYQLAPLFKDGETKVYCPSYWMGSVGGKATSRSGDTPSYGSPNSLTTLARTFDAGAFLEPMTARFSDYLLQLVEFANRNLKAIMAGAQIMRYNGEFDQIVSVVPPTSFTTTAAVGRYFVDGQSISVGSARNGSDRASNVKVNTIVTAGEVSTFTLNAPVPTMAVGDFISTRCWQNGATDVVTASSGSPGSNSDGKHPCIWRGKVDPWAHCFSTLADVLVKREGLGTAEIPYRYIPYFLPDPKKYAGGAITADYVRCNTMLPPTSGYVKSLAQDSRYPAAFGPAELGGASNTYASAYFYNYGYEVVGLLAGGSWGSGGGCSPVYFYCFPPAGTSVNFLGRLFVLPV